MDPRRPDQTMAADALGQATTATRPGGRSPLASCRELCSCPTDREPPEDDAPTGEAAANPESTAGQTMEPAVQVIGDDQAHDDAAGQGPGISNADDSLANTSAAYAQVSLGRRKISEVGLAAIGVGSDDANDRGLDAMIWRGTSASDAVFLLKKAAVISHSIALTDWTYPGSTDDYTKPTSPR